MSIFLRPLQRIVCIYMFSPVFIFRCKIRSNLSENALSHRLHLYGFSPVWVIRCGLKLPFYKKKSFITKVPSIWLLSNMMHQMYFKVWFCWEGFITQPAFPLFLCRCESILSSMEYLSFITLFTFKGLLFSVLTQMQYSLIFLSERFIINCISTLPLECFITLTNCKVNISGKLYQNGCIDMVSK